MWYAYATALAAILACSAIGKPKEVPGPIPTHGSLAGDVTATSVIIWSRADGPGTMHVRIGRGSTREAAVPVSADGDFTGKVRIDDLRPGTEYAYRVWFTAPGTDGRGHDRGGGAPEAAEGRFRTAPARGEAEAVVFGFGGDVGGQNVCRDSSEGYPIFKTLAGAGLDFFIGLGDLIYADNTCGSTGLYNNAQLAGDFVPSFDLDNFRKHWRYNRSDAGFRALAASTGYYPQWDDHEVVNDFGPLTDGRSAAPYTPGVHLMPIGLQAFLEYNPILPAGNTPERLYRKARWGKHLELFILDNRQYRESNLGKNETVAAPGTNEFPRTKTMLGREQKTWLIDGLKRSDATWKVIVSSVPLSIPTGSPPAVSGRDGWADHDRPQEGYRAELLEILAGSHARKDRILFITTDVHFGEAFRYTPYGDDWKFHELVTGPMNAGIFPNQAFDTTMAAERLFFFGPPNPVTSFAEAKKWFNFGQVEVSPQGKLAAKIVTTDGTVAYTLEP